MLKKQERIKKHEEFQTIIHSKNIEKNSAYIIYYQKSDNNLLRVGISVSKKIGNAVIRNKIKRQIRHIVYFVKNNYKKLDIIVIVRTNYQKNTFLENQQLLECALKNIWRKINEQI